MQLAKQWHLQLAVYQMQNKNTVNIKLPRKIKDINQVEKWEKLWKEASNANYCLPRDLSIEEIRDYFSVLMNRLPSEFVSDILGELAELDKTPWDLLESLFENGDSNCNVSICCRPDLPDNMLKKCLISSDQLVIEHIVFHEKVSIQQCESLLRRPLENSTVQAIYRAIVKKKETMGSIEV
jgi:hypothetical protein